MIVVAWHKQACTHLKLKAWPRFGPVGLSLPMIKLRLKHTNITIYILHKLKI